MLALVSAYPDVPETTLLASLPGLLAGSLAASTALILTIAIVVRPPMPGALRLVPGRETGRSLGVMVLATLSLGQALDSATTLAGLSDVGSIAVIRRALTGTVGPDLVGALVVIGLIAGSAEEVFFRGFMQTGLRQYWRAPAAVLATSVCFAVLHADASGLHVALAFILSVYLGFITEVSGSALPAVVCHVANNTVYTLQTAYGVTVTGRDANFVFAVGGAAVFAACVLYLRRPVSSP